MNFELLFKFVRLANNNPNEHEANAAARRVCKMIEDNKFKLVDTPIQKPVQKPVQQSAPFYQAPPSPRYQRPSDEPQPSYVRNPYSKSDVFNSFFNDRKSAWWNERPPTEAKIPEDYNPYESFFKEKTKSEKRDVPCSRCGKIEKSAFIGDTSTYLCYNCYFEAKANKK